MSYMIIDSYDVDSYELDSDQSFTVYNCTSYSQVILQIALFEQQLLDSWGDEWITHGGYAYYCNRDNEHENFDKWEEELSAHGIQGQLVRVIRLAGPRVVFIIKK